MQRTPWWLWAGPIGCVAVLTAIGYGPTQARAGREGLLGMFTAQALVLAVVYATLAAAVRQILRTPTHKRLQPALRAGVLRFLIALALAALLVLRFQLPAGPLLIWLAISYVLVVQVETIALVKWMATIEKQL